MNGSTAGGHRQYGATTVGGYATALLGDTYGDTYNIQQATILLGATTISQHENEQALPVESRKVVRQNEVFTGYTLETVTTFEDAGAFSRRGTSYRIEQRWERREDLGAGVFGEVHREELVAEHGNNDRHATTKSRAVKVLRRRQLERMGVDYKRELEVLIHMSQV